jgi:hypothetical protein
MKTNKPYVVAKALVALLMMICFPVDAFGHGTFRFQNRSAPTRLGSADGLLAGPGFWAHMLVGAVPEDLRPVGMSAEHIRDGLVSGGTITVPFISPGYTGYVQMVAWDGTAWGTDLSTVPLGQLGRTDVVPVFLASPTGVQLEPQFTLPAIVPPIPEPSTAVLGILGAFVLVMLWTFRFSRDPNRL